MSDKICEGCLVIKNEVSIVEYEGGEVTLCDACYCKLLDEEEAIAEADFHMYNDLRRGF